MKKLHSFLFAMACILIAINFIRPAIYLFEKAKSVFGADILIGFSAGALVALIVFLIGRHDRLMKEIFFNQMMSSQKRIRELEEQVSIWKDIACNNKNEEDK